MLGIFTALGFAAMAFLSMLPSAAASDLSDSTDTLFGYFPTIIELVITMMILSIFMGAIAMIFKVGPFKSK